MRNLILNYKIGTSPSNDGALKVKVFLSNLKNIDVLTFYNGQTNIETIKTAVPYRITGEFIQFKITNKDSFLAEYTISLGEKDVLNSTRGIVSEDLITFSGEQVLLMPVEVLSIGNPKNKFNKFDITIEHSFKNFKTAVMPFKKSNKSVLAPFDWGDVFELMKSSFVFSNLTRYKLQNNLNLYSDTHLDSYTSNVFRDIYNYYANIFNKNINLNLTVLNSSESASIFGGNSKSNICSYVDLESTRDYQKISKFIFQSFLDNLMYTNTLHMPPNLWIREGLSTYYSYLSLFEMENDFKTKYTYSFAKEFKSLYLMYIHLMEEDKDRYSFPPMKEGDLSEGSLINYLYLIKAPLLMYSLENHTPNLKKHIILDYLKSLNNPSDFSQLNLFKFVLGDNLNDFCDKFIFGNEILENSFGALEEEFTDDMKNTLNEILT